MRAGADDRAASENMDGKRNVEGVLPGCEWPKGGSRLQIVTSIHLCCQTKTHFFSRSTFLCFIFDLLYQLLLNYFYCERTESEEKKKPYHFFF